jgi:glucokinase
VRAYVRLLALKQRKAVKARETTARDVYRAARAGDPAARQAFDQVGRYLGAAIANFVHAFNPRMVVLAGGMAAAGNLLLGPVREVVCQSIYPEHEVGLEIRASRLRGTAGLLGAARLALVGDRR